MTRPTTSPARPARHAADGTVSATSAQRFAARVRARRRRRAALIVVVLAALALGVWGALASPWATVQRVEVTGTGRVDAAAVRDTAATEVGYPPLLARSVGAAAPARRAQPLLRSATATR